MSSKSDNNNNSDNKANKRYGKKEPRIDVPINNKNNRNFNTNFRRNNANNAIPKRNINIPRQNWRNKNFRISRYKFNQPSTNLVRINRRKRNNRKRNSNGKNKLHYLLNPMNAVLERRLFSIFQSDDKIMRFGIFTSWNFITSTTNDIKAVWFPLAGCMTQPSNFKDKDNADCPNLATFWYGTSVLQECHCFYQNLASVYGKYRIIGAELKITNTTNMTNRSGNYLVGKISLEDPVPLYVNKTDFPAASLDSSINNIKAAFTRPIENIATKQMYTADDIALIRYINAGSSNKIYNNFEEYLQLEYTSDIQFSGHCTTENDAVTGNNDMFTFNFYKTNVVQTYLIESYVVLEVIPYPSLNMGMACLPSIVEASNYEKRALCSASELLRIR